MGAAQIGAGAAAVAVPYVASLFAAASFAWILVFTGVFQIFHAYRVRRWQGFALHFAGGLLYAAAGLLILFNPLPGLMSLTLLLAALLIFEGALRVGTAYRVRPRDRWLWFALGGVASIVLGAVILLGWPNNATWVLGLVLGVELLLAGAINIPLAYACRSRQSEDSGALVQAH
jgi:uncharacterized membrane protein HdeD (DUF308 family)